MKATLLTLHSGAFTVGTRSVLLFLLMPLLYSSCIAQYFVATYNRQNFKRNEIQLSSFAILLKRTKCRGFFRTLSNIKMEHFAKIVND